MRCATGKPLPYGRSGRVWPFLPERPANPPERAAYFSGRAASRASRCSGESVPMRERIQKILSARGVASRRAAEELIRLGRVTVDGVPCALGASAEPDCRTIAVDGVPIPPPPEHVYLMLHKPRGYITTLSDERGRRTAASLVDCGTRVYPVGRLDYDSEGLLLFTNDGALADRLMHPRREISKVYEVTARGPLDGVAERLRRPLVLDGYRIRPPEVGADRAGPVSHHDPRGQKSPDPPHVRGGRAGGAPAAAHCRGTAAARNARARRMASAHRSGACRAAAGNRRGRSCMTADILTNIHNKLTTFSKGQRRIATYILESYDKAAFLTAGALGKITQVSESTVVRFAAELGYDGYPAMQRARRKWCSTA